DLVGTERYNDRLGLRRAQATLNYLVRQGIRRSRLDAIASRGESEPIVQTEDRERRNRRAVTTVAGFERNFVGNGMDGEVAQRLYNDYQIGDIDVTTADSTDTDG
ncbi:MAG: OmpA family protein, partial [Pseudomonadota bacterium]